MSGQSARLPEGGRIDRYRPLGFTFNGRRYRGYGGDTLASALLANGAGMVARSFKYHRPRGIYSAGAEEPNALVQLGTGAVTQPNLRATQVELFEGLEATSVNCWPSLGLDIQRLNDVAARLLPAGFYYKTFMWPQRLWPLYEHVIRHAAGLGRSPEAPDPDRYDKAHAHCDVLVVGAGPAGLAAALAAGRTGARVILVDEQAEAGGALLGAAMSIDGAPATEWVAAAMAELATMEEARVLVRTTAFAYYDDNLVALCERVTDHLGGGAPPGLPRQRLWKVRAGQVVLATGAIERPLVFAGNDRPGIMLAGAARTYLNRYAVRPGSRAVLFTNNDSAYAAAYDLAAGGVEVAAVVDARPAPSGDAVDRVRERGIEVLGGKAVVAATGGRRVKGVDVLDLNDSGEGVSGELRRIECDLVCLSGGWNPAIHLFTQAGGGNRLDPENTCFVPAKARQAVRAAGAANGAFALAECLRQGLEAGAGAAADAGIRRKGRARKAPVAETVESMALRSLWLVPEADGTKGKRFVDLANDVTSADIELAAREGYRSVEHAKRYTTLGMGPDQGKTGGIVGAAILARALGGELAETGTTTFRPPYTPVAFGALAGRDVGALADPERHTPMHHWHRRADAVFEDVGQWKRPFYYPRDGETKAEAVDRECLAVRRAIGLMDATTLGKIEIGGRDAVTLLNRIYTNAWSKLAVGRCRYGLMCGEDGMVMDDGVTARLDEQRFLMTTTTGNAARVLAWLEEWSQTEWPELKVHMTSVTEHWATATLAGPKARDLLAELCSDIDLGPEAFPFMTWREGTVAGLGARVFRVSFTGELSFEINVAARHGMALWTALATAGEKYGITPFGTEAMHVLRAEKGYIIVGQETDGTVTPGDLGMDWILSKKKDFIGRRSFSRPDTARGDRKQLVGLLAEDGAQVLPEGAHIVAERRAGPPMETIGHVTSSYRSATLGRSIALALIENGRARHGDMVHVPLPLENRGLAAQITAPVFHDPEGSRLDG
jgi:sarcosine oxidase subunit alpha